MEIFTEDKYNVSFIKDSTVIDIFIYTYFNYIHIIFI